MDPRQHHIHELAAELGATFLTDPPCTDPTEARANIRQRIVHAPTVVDDETYVANLHELGHIATGHGRQMSYAYHVFHLRTKDDRERQLVDERAAWDWARIHAQHWSLRMELFRAAAMASYERPDDEAEIARVAAELDLMTQTIVTIMGHAA